MQLSCLRSSSRRVHAEAGEQAGKGQGALPGAAASRAARRARPAAESGTGPSRHGRGAPVQPSSRDDQRDGQHGAHHAVAEARRRRAPGGPRRAKASRVGVVARSRRSRGIKVCIARQAGPACRAGGHMHRRGCRGCPARHGRGGGAPLCAGRWCTGQRHLCPGCGLTHAPGGDVHTA